MGITNMKCIVQKFGGTSVGSVERIREVAKKVVATKRRGLDVVVIVSAMAKETDRLLGLASNLCPLRESHETDVVAATGEMISAALTAMAIEAEGERARSFLGFQLPILTDSHPSRARILSVGSAPVLASLREGAIPVVAGFQGIDGNGRITTLGRGGSDSTAVAVAAALGGASCEIYTDVEGIYSADPRLCPEAVVFPKVSYGFMLEAAELGAKVMHDRSVALGMRYKVPITVRSAFSDTAGTVIGKEEAPTSCVALDRDVAQVSFFGRESLASLGTTLSSLGVPYTMLSQSAGDERVAVVPRKYLPALASGLRGQPLFVDREVSRVSVVSGLQGNPAHHVPALIATLSDEGIDCRGLTVGARSVSFLVPEARAVEAVRHLHVFCAKSIEEVH